MVEKPAKSAHALSDLLHLVEIRKLPPDRWREVRSIRLESLRSSPLAFGHTVVEEALSGERTWRKHMRSGFFAMYEGELVGMIACVFNKSAKFNHVAEIYSFYVRPGYRGKGIGRALLDRALVEARRNKRIVKVRLYVNGRQRTAVGMYERAGFVIAGRLEREMKVGRRLYDMLVMEKASL